jgi:hypothetical protein
MTLFPLHSINLSKNIRGIIEKVIARMKATKIAVISDTNKKLTVNVEINGGRSEKIILRRLDLDDSENTTIDLKGIIVNKPIKKGS